MALDFKQTSKRPTYRPKSRHTRAFNEFQGRHMPTRKLIGSMYTGDYNLSYWANVKRWLYKQVGRPMDKVYSDFIKEFRKSYKGSMSPKDILEWYIDEEKMNHRVYGPRFYKSPSGILCRYKEVINSTTYNRRREASQSHIDFNKGVLKDIKIGENETGPKYMGKLWVTAKGFTKILNVWLVLEGKWQRDPLYVSVYGLSKKERSYLEDFTIASVAGYGMTYKVPTPWDFYDNSCVYRFIVKLSDLK